MLPSPKFPWMCQKSWRLIACGFGSGLIRVAPGTWGTLAATIVWGLGVFLTEISAPILLAMPVFTIIGLLLSFILGIWACHRTGVDLGVSDHGAMVWDEWVAMWLVLACIPFSYHGYVLAFIIFRFFDIIKPVPIRQLDRHIKNGFGVMLDDLIAAGYTVLILKLFEVFEWIDLGVA